MTEDRQITRSSLLHVNVLYKILQTLHNMECYPLTFASYCSVLNTLCDLIPCCTHTILVHIFMHTWYIFIGFGIPVSPIPVTIRHLLRAFIGGMRVDIKQWDWLTDWRTYLLTYLFACLLAYLLTYLLIYLLTYSMQQSPSWEANWFCS